MVLFGLDISHHQGDRPQSWFHQARAAGCEYIVLKATESSGFVDKRFHTNLARARNAGMLVAAYHYQRAGISAAEQVANVRRVVPRDVPVIPDVEANSGNIGLTREIVRLLQDNNYRVPLSYIPRWYWQQIGQPNLAGLPPLWSSRYPNYNPGSLAGIYNTIPASYWNGYGGLGVGLLQFTSSARVAGYGPLDGNAFKGARGELAALFGGTTIPIVPTVPEEDTNMELTPGVENSRTLVVPTWAKTLVISQGFIGMNVHHVKFFGPTPETGHDTDWETSGEQWLDPARPWEIAVPAGSRTAEVFYTLESAGGQHTAVAGFRA